VDINVFRKDLLIMVRKKLDESAPAPTITAAPEEKSSTAKACSLAMQRVIGASRYEMSDIASYLGLSTQTLSNRMRGLTSFALEEALMICKLVDISLEDALKIAGMTQEEFENAWIFQWRRQNFAKHVAHLEADKKMPRYKIAEECGYSESWISRVLSGQAKLTPRAARVVETRMDLPESWLDQKPLSAPKGTQINFDVIVKTSHQIIAAIKQAGFDVDTDLLAPYLTSVTQLYNAKMATREGYDPETDAAQFQAIFEQLVMQLKMKEGLWKS
jgi:transcriptional regulator with XRE-family HTH domain